VFKRILNSQSRTIVSAAVILGAASLVSRLLGLFRDRILAGQFGAGDELDVYYAAFRIPDLVYSLLVLGAISAGFIPVFVGYLEKDKNKAWYLASSVLNLIGFSLMAIAGLLTILTPWLVKLVAPGFNSEKLDLTIQLTRIMFLSPFFLGLSAVFGGILQSFRRFLIYSLGPVMYNLGIIFGALVLVKPFGLVGLAYGVVLGAFLHLAVQIPAAWLCGFRWQRVFNFRFEGVKRIFRLMPPRILSLVLSQATVWAMTIFASFLSAGSIAIYNLAYNIWSFPLGIFGVSFALASFPKLSQSAQKKDKNGFVNVFSFTFRQILFFTLPASIFFIVLRKPIVEIILGTGQFSQTDVILTFQTLAYFSFSLFAEALILLFLRGFFAFEDAWKPFFIGLFAVGLRLLLAWFFSLIIGVPGLALGFSFGSIVYLLFLFVGLRYKVGFLDIKNIFVSGTKIFAASFLAGWVSFYLLNFLADFNVLSQGILAGLLGGLAYLFFAWLFRLNELNIFLSSLFSHLPWRRR
jgi:putative peptidoglycan lipid II flippase